MKHFVYSYVDAKGHWKLGYRQAANWQQCAHQLESDHIIPLSLHALAWPDNILHGHINSRVLALLFRQLAMALGSGVSLLEALSYMVQEQENDRLRGIISRLQSSVFAGESFSEGLSHEKGLAPMLSQWVAIGEKQGRLAIVLDEIANHLEHQEKLKKKVQQQLLYPVMVLVAVVLFGGFLSLVVMPMLARQFMGFDTEISGIMRFFLVIHDGLCAHGGLLLLCMALIAVGIIWQVFVNQKTGKRSDFWKQLVLKVPFLRKYYTLKIYVPFARFLGQLLSSGVPMGEAMQVIQQYFSTSLFAEDVQCIAKGLTDGGRISRGISQAAFVPPLARQMLLNGERYSKLPDTLLHSADYYEMVLFDELSLWVRFLEPLSVVLIGVLVLLMALGLFLPILDSYQSLLAS